MGTLRLNNHIVMAPLSRCRVGKEFQPTRLNAQYYAQRSSVGLIIAESAHVSPCGMTYLPTLGMYQDKHVSGWKKVTTAVHHHGGKIFAQLYHAGRLANPDYVNGSPVSASAIKPQLKATYFFKTKRLLKPKKLGLRQIEKLIDQFIHAAVCAWDSGFDGIELHAAGGFLIDQFIRDGTNQRNDDYGGSTENRCRFLLEIIDSIKSRLPNINIGIRISPEDSTNDMYDSNPMETFSYLASKLTECNILYLHVREKKENGIPNLYKNIREKYHGYYISNGRFDFQNAERAIANGEADLLSYGLPFISNPDLVSRLKYNQPFNNIDYSTLYTSGPRGYVDYPLISNVIDNHRSDSTSSIVDV